MSQQLCIVFWKVKIVSDPKSFDWNKTTSFVQQTEVINERDKEKWKNSSALDLSEDAMMCK